MDQGGAGRGRRVTGVPHPELCYPRHCACTPSTLLLTPRSRTPGTASLAPQHPVPGTPVPAARGGVRHRLGEYPELPVLGPTAAPKMGDAGWEDREAAPAPTPPRCPLIHGSHTKPLTCAHSCEHTHTCTHTCAPVLLMAGMGREELKRGWEPRSQISRTSPETPRDTPAGGGVRQRRRLSVPHGV